MSQTGKRLEITCDRCGDLIFWDRNSKIGKISKRTGKDEGWWVGDLDKVIHTMDRCKEVQKTKGITLKETPATQTSNLLPLPVIDQLTDEEKLFQIKIKASLRKYHIAEAEAINDIGREANGAKLGNVINWLRDDIL